MKYEAVFGNQDLFDGESCAAIIVIKSNGTGRYTITENECSDIIKLNVCQPDIEIAMRRIIAEPKRWTVADQQAGRDPKVGCMVMVTSVDECASVAAINNDAVCVVFHDGEFTTLHKSGISPLETPEEKADRLRSEWVELVRDNALISADEYTTEAIYNALLSGTLSVPTKSGE